MSLNLTLTKRIECESFIIGYCDFYQTVCFHDDSNPDSTTSRCYRLIPRTDNEFMGWMSDICKDCNESVCNDCDVYIDYMSKNKL
jgi:hypothetical protein